MDLQEIIDVKKDIIKYMEFLSSKDIESRLFGMACIQTDMFLMTYIKLKLDPERFFIFKYYLEKCCDLTTDNNVQNLYISRVGLTLSRLLHDITYFPYNYQYD